MNRKNLILSMFAVPTFLFSVAAQATIYFYWDAESHPCDSSELPNPPFWTQNEPDRGHVACGDTPQGGRFIEFKTHDNQHSAYTEIHPSPNFPIKNIIGKTFYLAYFFNFSRINGLDIWYEDDDSADKGIELEGTGVRWTVSRGHWSNLVRNQDHHYTIWGGNPSYHLNESLENYDIILPNQSGYSADNTVQLPYETWHSAVMAVKMATDNTGSYTVWINGEKYLEYLNIKTAGSSDPDIENIQFGGTFAQPAYDSPAHKRQFDALILTDNWQDIINGGYLEGGTNALMPPTNLRIEN